MILLDALKVPFRWYKQASQQIRNDAICAESATYKLITPKDRLLPFQFRYPSPTTGYFPDTWRIYYSGSNVLAANLDGFIGEALNNYRLNGNDYILYKGGELPGLLLLSGYYYSVITLQDGTAFTSEDFWIDCDLIGNTVTTGDFSEDFSEDFGPAASMTGLKKYIKLIWWNKCDLGELIYQTGYQNFLYIDTAVSREPALIEEDGDFDGKKDYIVNWVKYTDIISLKELVPEYILNALMAVGVHSNAVVITSDNNYVGLAKRFECTFEMQTPCMADVTLKFRQETLIMRGNCCESNGLIDLFGCNVQIGAIVMDSTGGNDYHLEWPVLSGTPTDYEVIVPFISGGAPQYQTTTSFNITVPVGTYTISVRPRCNINGRYSFGNTVTAIVTGV